MLDKSTSCVMYRGIESVPETKNYCTNEKKKIFRKKGRKRGEKQKKEEIEGK